MPTICEPCPGKTKAEFPTGDTHDSGELIARREVTDIQIHSMCNESQAVRAARARAQDRTNIRRDRIGCPARGGAPRIRGPARERSRAASARVATDRLSACADEGASRG